MKPSYAYERDAAAIYRRSFAIIRGEADLARFSPVEERVAAGLTEELSLEDRINEEVRIILEAYQQEMLKSGAQYAEMFKKVKGELARKYKAVL